MQRLRIVSSPENNLVLHVSDLRVVQFYRRSLDNRWTSPEDVKEFCAGTIQLAVENMVIRNILTCDTDIDQTTFLYFFKFTNILDYLAFREEEAVGTTPGYLEKLLIEAVSDRPGRTLADHIAMLVARLLPDKDYVNPGRHFINQCVLENESKLWAYTEKIHWFHKKIDITLTQEREDRCINELNSAVRPIIVERNHNRAFRDFSIRLYNEIYSHLNNKERPDD